MRAKLCRIRGQPRTKDKAQFIDLDLEFEGERAFVVWDCIAVGKYQLKARVEIDPKLLSAQPGRQYDFEYNGELVLPRPENN